jgi:TonB family protein
MRTLLVAAALVAPFAAAEAAPARAPALGRMITVGGDSQQPQVALSLDEPQEAEPGLYRRIALNWRARTLQSGTYPAAAYAAGREGDVGLSLAIDDSGRLTGCSVTESSGEASIDAHACPHLTRNAVFHPALDDQGRRRGGTIAASLRYTIRLYVNMPAPGGDAPTAGPARPPRPLEATGFASFGVAPGTRRPADVWGLGATLAVDEAGAVTACTMHSPSYVDAIDKAACDRLRAHRFEPARDSEGRAVTGRFAVSAGWP